MYIEQTKLIKELYKWKQTKQYASADTEPTFYPKGKELKRLEFALYAQVYLAVMDGYGTFLFGACRGFDMLAAKQVLLRKHRDPDNTKLIAVLPFKAPAQSRSGLLRSEFRSVLSRCDDVIILHDHHRLGYYFERNRHMVDQSNRLICYYDGGRGVTGYTVRYAEAKGIEIVNLYQI